MKERNPMNLQLFAEENATAGAIAEEGTEQNQPQKPTIQPPAQPAAPPAQGEDISKIVARESRKALEKLLQEAGITGGDNPELKLKDYKKWVDGQKSDLEKAQEAANGAAQTIAQKDTELMLMQAQLEALKQGVKGEAAGDIIALAERMESWKDDKATAIAAVLAKYPQFAQQSVQTTQMPNPAGGTPAAGTLSHYQEQHAAAMKAGDTAHAVHVKNEAAKKGLFF